jgi:glycosyltransferase involved in cell wall biosynthesis
MLSVGYVAPIKGHDVAISAAASFAASRGLEVKLIVAGSHVDPKYATQLQASARSSGVALQLVGARSDVIELMGSADVLLHCAYKEGFPTVIGEAMSVGLPVIATDAGSISDFVHDGVGLVVSPGDASAVAGALEQLWADPRAVDGVRAAARRTAVDKLSPVAVARIHAAALRHAANAAKASKAI